MGWGIDEVLTMLKRLAIPKRLVSAAAASLAVVFASAAPSAADAMRCGNQLVQVGDTLGRVEALCGPADEVLPTETRHHYVEAVVGHQLTGIAQSVALDVWIYNGSSNQLSRSLHFENGVLRAIEIIKKR